MKKDKHIELLPIQTTQQFKTTRFSTPLHMAFLAPHAAQTRSAPARPGVAAMAIAGPVPMERPKTITESCRSHHVDGTWDENHVGRGARAANM